MTFARRRLNLKIQLGQGDFGESGFDTVEIDGLRMQAEITQGNSVANGTLALQAFGLTLDLMNKLTILKQDYMGKESKRLNYVTLLAGNEDEIMVPVFFGSINEAWAMFDPPTATLNLTAITALNDMLKPVTPTSFKGEVDLALVMSGLAAQMGRGFENNGVSVIRSNVYYRGTAVDQMRQCMIEGDFNAVIDSYTGRLVIWPRNGSRSSDDSAILISRETGLVGYPAYTQTGVSLTMEFNPNIGIGSRVKVESQLTPANGFWTTNRVQHMLESEMPNGRWFTTCDAHLISLEAPIARR